jgi:hypothetical protein
MKKDARGSSTTRVMAAAAVVLGLGAGSYGIASAASGTNSTATETTAQSTPATPDPSNPWGGQRSDETPLTGDTLVKVRAAAQAEVADATIVRVETDADGNPPMRCTSPRRMEHRPRCTWTSSSTSSAWKPAEG